MSEKPSKLTAAKWQSDVHKNAGEGLKNFKIKLTPKSVSTQDWWPSTGAPYIVEHKVIQSTI